MEQAHALVALPEFAGAKPAPAVDALFGRVLGRHATRDETAAALQFLESARSETLREKDLTPWEQLAQTVLISNEAIFLD